MVYKYKGLHAKALEYFEKSLQTSQNFSEEYETEQAISLINIGTIYDTLGDMEKAMEHY